MFENISSTLQQCGCFFVAGIVAGLFYELFRVARMAARHNTVAVFIEDILFFSLCGLVSFIIALSVGIGYFRIYYIVFEALGAGIYFLTLGRAVSFVMGKIVKVTKRIFYAVYKKLLLKIGNRFVSIAKKIKGIFGKIAEILPKPTINHQNDLQYNDDVVYNEKTVLGEGGESGSAIKAQIRKKA